MHGCACRYATLLQDAKPAAEPSHTLHEDIQHCCSQARASYGKNHFSSVWEPSWEATGKWRCLLWATAENCHRLKCNANRSANAAMWKPSVQSHVWSFPSAATSMNLNIWESTKFNFSEKRTIEWWTKPVWGPWSGVGFKNNKWQMT